jgi:hypothetical protein
LFLRVFGLRPMGRVISSYWLNQASGRTILSRNFLCTGGREPRSMPLRQSLRLMFSVCLIRFFAFNKALKSKIVPIGFIVLLFG